MNNKKRTRKRMKRTAIGLDMDGVVYPFVDAFSKLYKYYGGKDYEWRHNGTYVNMKEAFDDPEAVDKAFRDPRIFNCVPPYDGAVETVTRLTELPGVDVIFLTAPTYDPGGAATSKWNWIKTYWPDWEFRNFMMTTEKWRVNVDILIDDLPRYMFPWLLSHPGKPGYLIEREWNYVEGSDEAIKEYGLPDDANITRVSSLEQAVDILSLLIEGKG